jgi:hypothetical protein
MPSVTAKPMNASPRTQRPTSSTATSPTKLQSPRSHSAIDAFHHAVYAVATGVAYDLLRT